MKDNCSHYFLIKDKPPEETLCRYCNVSLSTFNEYENLRMIYDWSKLEGDLRDWNEFKRDINQKKRVEENSVKW